MFGISPMRTGSRGSHEWDVMASLCREDRINAGYPLVLAFQTTTANETITLPAQTSKHFYSMWGDGITEKCTGITEHVYDKPGAYIVRLMGDVDAVSFHETPSANKLINILNWGSIQWKTLKGAFSGCKNLVGTASDEPSLTYCTDISYAFMNASKFVGNVSGWDVRNVSSATGTFLNAKSFNQNLELWDVQNIAALRILVENNVSIVPHLKNSKDIYIDGKNIVESLESTRDATKLVMTGYTRVIGSGEYQPKYESEFIEALMIEPKHPGANHFFFRMFNIHLALAESYAKNGDHRNATYCYELAFKEIDFYISLRPDSAKAYHNRGLIYLNGGEYLGLKREESLNRAQEDFSKALTLSPNHALENDIRALMDIIDYLLQQ